jgi:hypothetical protein
MNLDTSLISIIIIACVLSITIIFCTISVIYNKFFKKIRNTELNNINMFNPLDIWRPMHSPEARAHVNSNRASGNYLERSEDPLPLYESRVTQVYSNIITPISQSNQIQIQIHQPILSNNSNDSPPTYKL